MSLNCPSGITAVAWKLGAGFPMRAFPDDILIKPGGRRGGGKKRERNQNLLVTVAFQDLPQTHANPVLFIYNVPV